MFLEVEKEKFSDREQQFLWWCKKEGIERFLFDLDDTICSTREIFKSAIEEVCDLLSSTDRSLGKDEWRNEVKAINNRLFEKVGVNPNRWNLLVDELSEKYKLANDIGDELRKVFQGIYLKPPSMKEGAEEGLMFIKRAGLAIGIVTHANREWTLRKYEWLNLGIIVGWEEIFLVDENFHKTEKAWLEAIEYFGLKPETCAVVGDSPRTDINPAKRAGVRHCFLVEGQDLWEIHNQPVEPSVWRIRTLTEIPEIVLRGNYHTSKV